MAMVGQHFRLIDIRSGVVSTHDLGSPPPYVAISHAWSEKLFPLDVEFVCSPGREAVIATADQKFPGIAWCWVDTRCILQDSIDDKARQIPLMGLIFSKAEAIVIVLNHELKLHQPSIDSITDSLAGAVAMHEEESWLEHGDYWQNGAGRDLIRTAMLGLRRLSDTAWATRIWTLQEYIMAKSVIWVGEDRMPVVVQDILFAALPDICDTLGIDECLVGAFEKLFAFYSGMANCRLGRIDRTRVMELLGNRTATLECDEVYGIMAASGVEIPVRSNETKENVWQYWFEEAVRQGHLRWLLMPKTITSSPAQSGAPNCVMVPFHQRHKISLSSALDTVTPLGPAQVIEGTVYVSARWVGYCSITSRLGRVHEPRPGRIHRDITLILFSKGRFDRALAVSSAFGAGRYNSRQRKIIARTLVSNHARAILFVKRGKEDSFRVRTSSSSEFTIWQDFMAFQMGQMPGVNNGIAYLAVIKRESLRFDVAIVLGDEPVPRAGLEVIDLNGRTVDKRSIFMVVHRQNKDPRFSAVHKTAVTLPMTGDFEAIVQQLPVQNFAIGGEKCAFCHSDGRDIKFIPSTESLVTQMTTTITLNQVQKKVRLQRIIQNLQTRHFGRQHNGRTTTFHSKLKRAKIHSFIRNAGTHARGSRTLALRNLLPFLSGRSCEPSSEDPDSVRQRLPLTPRVRLRQGNRSNGS